MKVLFSGQLGEFFTHLNWESKKVKELNNLTKVMGENSTILVEVDKRDHRRIKEVGVIEGGWLSRRWEMTKRRLIREKTFHFGKNDIRRDIASYLDYLTEEVATLDKVSCDEKILHREAEKLEQLEQDVGEIADQLFHNTARGRALKGKMERLKRAFNDRFALPKDDRKMEEFGNLPMREPVGTLYVPEEGFENILTDNQPEVSSISNVLVGLEEGETEWAPVDDLRFLCKAAGLEVDVDHIQAPELKRAISARVIELKEEKTYPAFSVMYKLFSIKSPHKEEYLEIFRNRAAEFKESEVNTRWLMTLLAMMEQILHVRDSAKSFEETEWNLVNDLRFFDEKLGLEHDDEWYRTVSRDDFMREIRPKVMKIGKGVNIVHDLLEIKSPKKVAFGRIILDSREGVLRNSSCVQIF